MAWMALKGWPASEVWTSLHPALGLAKSLGRHDAVLPISYGLWTNVITQGRIAESLNWVNDMLVTAEASGDPDLLIVARQAACQTHFWQGDLTQSRAQGDKVMALYDEEQHRYLADLTNIDPKTSCRHLHFLWDLDAGLSGSCGAGERGQRCPTHASVAIPSTSALRLLR